MRSGTRADRHRRIANRRFAEFGGKARTGSQRVNSAKGAGRHTLYNFRLGFDLAAIDQPPQYFVVDEIVQGMDWADHPDFDVLIGMDVIAKGDIEINRDGAFRFDLP